jgi:hypothetical protein
VTGFVKREKYFGFLGCDPGTKVAEKMLGKDDDSF